ncbi:MAG: hypothetical protein WBK67_03515 [Minisyncoccales bacterium]|jgi:hypothetical protein
MNKKRLIIISIVAIVLIVLISCFVTHRDKTEPIEELVRPPQHEAGPADMINTVLVDLKEFNDSGFFGTATIDEYSDGSSKVLVLLDDFSGNVAIFSGSCSDLGESKTRLNNLRSGVSETEFESSADEIAGSGGFAIIVFSEEGNVMACGDK